ncbi:MAG: amidohydrolase family protein [Bacteroidetes bacterium]|nr:amidohydrolase family protein [Bacteroidota bacterium]MDA1332737.1 amidohydrolase family protein [Bacteroidota bacterium]
MKRIVTFIMAFVFLAMLLQSAQAQKSAILAGRLIDSSTGTATANQIILVEHNPANGRSTILEIGSNVTIPDDATVIDLSDQWVMGGLVDAHDHLGITYKEEPENWNYYYTVIQDSTPLRAIQSMSTGFQKLASGFTIVRDLGNNGLYADTALRQAIEMGWVPGPTMINSGIIIGAFGGQFYETPEREDTVYPEYLNADTNDEIVKAIRRNIHYGAKVIKVCVDCQAYPYTIDQLKLFVSEAANAGQKVSGHVQTREGARRAIEAGLWSLDHDGALDEELHSMMAERGIWRVGTETPKADFMRPMSDERWERRVRMLRDAYDQGVKLAFSTDADYFIPGFNRGELTIEFLRTWKAADIPDAEILKVLTTNGYEISELEDERGPLKVGFAADIIATAENPLDDINALRDVRFVMKNGMVFKKDGVVSSLDFFHNGPAYGWRKR